MPLPQHTANHPHLPPEIAAVERELQRLRQYPVDPAQLDRHASNLSRLATRLRRMGMEENDIAGHVLGIFGAYERALTETFPERGHHA